MYELDATLELLGDLEQRIREGGPIAPDETTVEVVPHSKSGKRYARKRTKVDGKNTFEGCGLEGEYKHLAAVATVQRRTLLEQLDALTEQIRTWQAAEEWQALKPPQTKTQTTAAAVEVVDAAEIEAKEPPHQSRPRPAESDVMSFAFKGNKGATPENRLVHAVPGVPPMAGFAFWDTPALCGAKPDWLKNWGWIGDCTIMYLSCRKCEKKLGTTPHSIMLPEGFGNPDSWGLIIE